MKKLMAMIGAVAMSFGLFAATPFSISFETAESEKGVSEGAFNPNADGVTGWTWAGDPFTLAQYAVGETLPYADSGDNVRRNAMFTSNDNDNYLPLETGTDELVRSVGTDNLCLDQLVKFTGFEDPQTNLVEGTKIAIWMSEFENEDESTTTNLYVTVGKVDALGNVEKIALPVAPIDGIDGYELNTWYRLTVKSLGNIIAAGGSRAGFLIYINGQKVASSDSAATELVPENELTSVAYNCMTNKQLFTAIDDLNATFASVGYQGIGAIDDVILDDVGPAFTVETVDVTFADVTGAVIVKVVDSDGTEFTDFSSAIAVKPGALVVTLEAAEGYKMKPGAGTYNVNAEAAGKLTIPVGEGDFVEVYATKNGTVKYGADELYTMITGLVDGDVVLFNKSAENVTNDVGETVYGFSENTTIDVAVDNEAITWDVAVSNTTDGAGAFTDNVGVDAGNTLNVWFETDEEAYMTLNADVAGTLKVEVGMLVVESDIEVSGTLEAAALSIDSTIALAVGGKVITADGEIDDETITVPENYELDVQGPDEDDLFTYSAAQSGPEPTVDTVTFTVTYDDTKVENVTVTTNSEAVADVEGVYTVKSNAVVTIVATAAAGYQNVTITSEDVTIDNGVFTADVDDATITIDAEEIPAAGFKIIISGIDAADVTEDATTITIATEAQPLVYIGGVAATVGGEAGAWTVTKPEITADTAISIVAATTIPATGHAWYENPTLMGKVTVAYGKDGCGGWNGAKDLAGDYIAAAFGYSGLSAVVTKISDLVAGNGGEVAPIAVYPASEIGGSLRGAGVSTALGVTIFGSAETHEITVISLDGLTTNKVTTSNGVIPDSFWFSDDGQFLYANGYEEVSGDSTAETAIRQNVYKYAIVDNLIGDGEKLVLSETYTVGKRVRGMTKFGDVILARTDDGYYAIDLAATEPAFAKVGAGGKCDDVVIAGGHFYHLSSSTGILSIYNLNTAGTWYEGEAIATYNVANVLGCRVSDTGNNFFVTPDEETLVFCETVAQTPQVVKAFQWTLPTYDITIAKVENGTLETSVTNGIAAGTTVNVYATPLEGYKIASVTTNGAELVGDSFEMPAENVTIAATFALQQFTVADISVENATAVATNTATDTGLDLPATVDYNTAIVVTVTPDTGYEYKSAPAGWTKNDNGSITTNATVTADLAITVEAPTAADPWNPPTKDDEASQKVADLGFSQTAAANITTVAEFTKFENYVKTASGETDPAQLTENQKANAYLAYALNATAIPTEEITSDDVEITSFEGGVIEITIEGITVGSDVSSEMIAKVIDVVGNDELTEMSAENVTTTGRAGVNGKVQVTVAPADDFAESTKFFYRASVKK